MDRGLITRQNLKTTTHKDQEYPELQRHGPLKAILLYIEINKRIQVAKLCGDDPSKAVSGHNKVCQAVKVTQLSWYGAN